MRSIPLCVALTLAARLPLIGQTVLTDRDSRHSMLRDTTPGALSEQASVSHSEARHRCMHLPAASANDRLQGPHGDSLVTASCEVVEYRSLGQIANARWFAARYRWISLFTAEDTGRGPAARDTVTEEETVVFEPAAANRLRAVWHARFETGDEALWRSVTAELAAGTETTLLLSVMSCVNGTGGCSQDFLQRHPDRRWALVRQVWLDQLPKGFSGRIRHGVRIDPRTLKGETGFYDDRDPNCCPSSTLRFQLVQRGDSLVLGRYTVTASPGPRS
jgi:hypothetical protein